MAQSGLARVARPARFNESRYRPGQPGNDFKAEVGPIEGEPIIPKRGNSAFIGTDLEERLRAGGHEALVVVGVITNNSVEATVRMAGNLGFFDLSRRRWMLHVWAEGLERRFSNR
jgi:nicotinamidase-related amidase